MTLLQDSREHIDQVADETLKQFDKVSAAARAKLGEASGATVHALASINTMTQGSAIDRLAKISDENHRSYLQLAAEPAISRVVVENEEGKRQTYFICRDTPMLGMATFAFEINAYVTRRIRKITMIYASRG